MSDCGPVPFAVLLLAGAFAAQPALAQKPVCPADAGWRDADYAHRSTSSGGRSVSATVKRYANVQLAEIDADGDKTVLMTVSGARGDDSVALTYGAKQPAPAEFAEIALAVEPPMADGSWRRFPRPCALADGSRTAFDESDLPGGAGGGPTAAAPIAPALRGVLTRRGTEFDYAVTIANDGAGRTESWQGKLRFGAPARTFDLATDVQGWHVYRGGVFVMTIPLGQPAPLSAVLNGMRDRSLRGD